MLSALKNHGFAVIATFLAVTFSGCLQYEESIEFEDDGSGTISVSYSMSRQIFGYFEQAEQMRGTMPQVPNVQPPLPFDVEVLRRQLTHVDKDKCELVALTSNNGTVQFRVKFSSIDDLEELTFQAFADSDFTFASVEEENEEGEKQVKYEYSRELKSGIDGSLAGAAGQAQAMMPQIQQQLTAAGKPAFKFNVKMPENIEDANVPEETRSRQIRRNTVYWLHESDDWKATEIEESFECVTELGRARRR
ncbi:MAG: hypothetical protein NUW37_16850 [Planctomycetes bacterium]|nr:hypothetical protein [Planctomycetota bacterium]